MYKLISVFVDWSLSAVLQQERVESLRCSISAFSHILWNSITVNRS